MLFEPGHTPFDLHFRIFGVQVRVHPFFWVISAALGWNIQAIVPRQQFLPYLALWIACVFVSILLHELGHVFMGQRFHSYGHIVLHGFGGLAIGSSNVPRRWQHIAVSAAGPAVQLVLWALLEFVLGRRVLLPGIREHHWHVSPALVLALDWMIQINLWWALLNLLPIWPLDGGQIARQACSGMNPGRGLSISLWISILVAGALAILEFAVYNGSLKVPYIYGDLYLAIFFALFAVNNIQELQMLRYKQRDGWEGSDW